MVAGLRQRTIAGGVLLVAVASVALGCGSTSQTNRTTATSERPPTGSTSSVTPSDTDTAVWPFAGGTTRYRDPVQAAGGFAIHYLGFVDPVVGAYMAGDGRSGEVVIRPSIVGPKTIVLVRQLTSDESWWVLGAATADLQLRSPAWNAPIASPVTLAGESTAFEATVNVEIRQDGSLTPLARDTVMGGSMGQLGPFSKAVRFGEPTAPRGAIVLKTLSAKDGDVAEATVLRVQFTDLPKVVVHALDTGDLATLRPYLAPAVGYAIAASGAYGTTTPEGAIARLSYFAADHGPWSFAIPPARLESFKRGSYARYLGDDTYFFVSPSKGFVSVRVNSAGAIDQIFLAIRTDLLR